MGCLFLITYFIELFLLFSLSGVDKVIDAAYLDSTALFMSLSFWNRCIYMGLKLPLGRMNMGKNCFFLVVRYVMHYNCCTKFVYLEIINDFKIYFSYCYFIDEKW
jgi:hypothetical protein